MNPKERPILFAGPMIRALLDGSKTMTRRVIKPQPILKPGQSLIIGQEPKYPFYWHWDFPDHHDLWGDSEDPNSGDWGEWRKLMCPYGEPGDRLWCKEKWRVIPSDAGDDFAIEYAADGTVVRWRDYAERYCHLWGELYSVHDLKPLVTPEQCRYRSALHLYREFSRLTLELCSVRVERLQEISEADAIAEGCIPTVENGWLLPIRQFPALWDSLNGKKHPWQSNPWTWVLTFRRLTP